MSCSSQHVGKPSPLPWASVLIGLPLILTLGFAGASLAQSPDGSGPGDSANSSPHHRRRGTLGWFQGPPQPEIMRDSIGVSDGSLQRYTQRYQEYMAATKQSRDSVRANMQAMRTAFESGNRSEARARHETIERQVKQLAERDKKFDEGLKDILSKDQQNRYQEWRKSREKRTRHHWRHDGRSQQSRAGWTFNHEKTTPYQELASNTNPVPPTAGM
jgi:Spy/CpxP family protein refolding chaperone